MSEHDTDETGQNRETYGNEGVFLEAADMCSPDAYPIVALPSEPGTANPASAQMGRRVFLAGVGAAAATAAVGTGTAAASGGALDWDAGLVPDPEARETQTIEENDLSEMSSELQFYDDAGELASLADEGYEIEPREEPDDDDANPIPHNPVSLRADYIYDEEFYLSPRDRTFENADGDDEDVTILDERHWDGATEFTIEDADVGHGGPALSVQTEGVGAQVAATFNEISIDETDRNYLALVLNVVTLPDTASVEIAVLDEAANEKSVHIENGLDPMDDDVVTDSEGYGHVYQQQLGELVGDELSEIDSIEIRVSDADVELEFAAWGLNRTSTWEFGDQEYLDEDDEIDTETLEEPSGKFEITGFDSLPDMFSNAVINDYDVDVVQLAENLDSDRIDVWWEDGDLYDRVGHFVYTFESPSQFALDPNIEGIYYEQNLSEGRYETVEVAVNVDDPVDEDDVDDVSWTDQSSAIGDEGDDVELSTVYTDGEYVAVHFEVKYHADEEETATSPPAMGPTGREGGGLINWFTGIPGMILTAIGGVGLWRHFRGGE